MATKKYPNTRTLERRIVAYPSPKYFNLFTGFAKENEFRVSEAVNEIVKSYFDSLPDDKRLRYMESGMKNKNHY
jgi:hypothetical protein